MPEHVDWFHRRVGTRQVLDMLDAGVVEEVTRWALAWYFTVPLGILSAYLGSPLSCVTMSDFDLKEAKSCPDLPLLVQSSLKGYRVKIPGLFLLPTQP